MRHVPRLAATLAALTLLLAAGSAQAATTVYRITGDVLFDSRLRHDLGDLFDLSLTSFSGTLTVDGTLPLLKAKGPTKKNSSAYARYAYEELMLLVGGQTLLFGPSRANYVEVKDGGATKTKLIGDTITIEAGDGYEFTVDGTRYKTKGSLHFVDMGLDVLSGTGLPVAGPTDFDLTFGQFQVRKGSSLIGTLALGNLSIAPASLVPEPSTWAMMILAFALLGHAAKRHRRTARLA